MRANYSIHMGCRNYFLKFVVGPWGVKNLQSEEILLKTN